MLMKALTELRCVLSQHTIWQGCPTYFAAWIGSKLQGCLWTRYSPQHMVACGSGTRQVAQLRLSLHTSWPSWSCHHMQQAAVAALALAQGSSFSIGQRWGWQSGARAMALTTGKAARVVSTLICPPVTDSHVHCGLRDLDTAAATTANLRWPAGCLAGWIEQLYRPDLACRPQFWHPCHMVMA